MLRPSLIRRFFLSVKEEGWRPALQKAKTYTSLVVLNQAPTALPETAHNPTQHMDTPSNAPSEGSSGQQYLAAFWSDVAQRSAFHIQRAPALLSQRRSIAVIGDLNLPQCRKYRVEQPSQIWEQLGVKYDFSSLQDLPRAVRILQQATHVFLYRTPNCPLLTMYLYEARRLKLPILYDIDDPLFSVSAYETYSNMQNVSDTERSHFIAAAPGYLDAMNMADFVTVSTPLMANHTRLYTSRPVHVRRNFADQETLETAQQILNKSKQSDTDQFCLAFASGSIGHEADFAIIQESVTAFLKEDPHRKLLILGRFDTSLLPRSLEKQIDYKPFVNYREYLSALAAADCNLMPLSNDVFNQCKSGVRLLDAAAVKVPSLVSEVGDLPHLVEDGKTGCIMKENDDWLAILNALAKEKKACRAMGAAAHHHVSTKWSAHPRPPIIDNEVIEWVCK